MIEMNQQGNYHGRHFTTYVEEVKQLIRQGELVAAERLLLELVEATEGEAAAEGLGVAPWYFHELAKIYRRRKEYGAECSILERYANNPHAPGMMPEKLASRLEKARELLKLFNKHTSI